MRLGRRLRDRDAAALPDVAEPRGAVLARARQHDADGVHAALRRERAQEAIDRQVLRPVPARHQAKLAVRKLQVMTRRDHVDPVRLHHRRPRDLRHRDARPILEQRRDPALPLRIEVHDHHVGHPAVGHHGLEEGL
jgi:hypothetical protein